MLIVTAQAAVALLLFFATAKKLDNPIGCRYFKAAKINLLLLEYRTVDRITVGRIYCHGTRFLFLASPDDLLIGEHAALHQPIPLDKQALLNFRLILASPLSLDVAMQNE